MINLRVLTVALVLICHLQMVNTQAVDAPLCALLPTTDCTNKEIARQCPTLCPEDAALCSALDPSTHCTNEAIARECPNLCRAAPPAPPAPPADQCPTSEGFILSPSRDQCFKRGGEEYMQWDAAVSLCKQNRMELAVPSDNNAVWLQQTLQDKYGDNYPYAGYWVNCRGNGEVFTCRTRGDNLVLPSDSPLWWPGQPSGGFGSDRCVDMTAYSYHIESHPGKLYLNIGCSSTSIPLCERILQ